MPKPVPIDLPQLAHFSIDEDGPLYWHGKAVQTESVVVLSGRQSTWAIVIAIATVVAALSSAAYTGLYWSSLRPHPQATVAPQSAPAQIPTAAPSPSPPSKPDQKSPAASRR
jgi:hypothetical protein